MRTTLLIIAALLIGAIAPGAGAQDDPWANLEAVDAGTVDVGPLGESLWVVPIDMRTNDGFSRIYRLEGVDGWEDQFARREGAITAVFSQSVYLPSSLGGGIAIPAGTVFFIGDPPDWMRQRYNLDGRQEPARTPSGSAQAFAPTLAPDTRILTGVDVGAIDTSAASQFSTPTASQASPSERTFDGMRRPPTPWRTDERRANRVSSLLSLAVAGD